MTTPAKLPPTEVFYVGKHVDAHGRAIEFTRADLEKACAAYDPVAFAAPIVIGHPTHDAPALGWLNTLYVNDQGVMVSEDPTDVHPEFAALVEAKRYPRVSISFFQPNHSANPKPGVWYPRHLGYLGGSAPALPGLKVANFSAAEDSYVTFGAYDGMSVASLFRSLKNFFFVRFGSTDRAAVEEALPEYMINSLQLNAAQELAEQQVRSPMFSAPGGSSATTTTSTKVGDPVSDDLKAAQAATAAATARAEAAEAKIAAHAQQARAAEFSAQADVLVKAHKLHPDEVEGFVAFMARPDEALAFEFSAADGTKKNFNGADWLKKFIDRRGALVAPGEMAGGKAATTAPVAFAAPEGLPVASDRLELHQRATDYAAANKVDYLTAVKAVQ